MRKWLVAACAALLLPRIAAAAGAFDTGTQDAQSWLPQAQDSARMPDYTAVPEYQGTNVPETGYRALGAGIEDRARAELPGHSIGSQVASSAATRPQFAIDQDNDPVFRMYNTISGNPEAVAGAITGQYSGCRQVSVPAAPATYSEARCTEWPKTEMNTCVRELEVACRTYECDAGGVVLSSIASDMSWTYSYPTLTLGTIADNYWSGSKAAGAVYDRRTTFEVRDVTRIKEFRLVRAGFDDWMLVKLNGQIVYVGPYGGDRLEQRPYCIWYADYGDCAAWGAQIYYTATQWGSPELKTSWDFILNVDLKPYLKADLNSLDMRVIVAGRGEGWMQFRVAQYCQACTDTWSESIGCAALREREAQGACAGQGEVCTDGPGSRVVDGESVHRDCWRYETRYECAGSGTQEESYCQELRDQGCQQIGSECTDALAGGACGSYEQTYRCPASEEITQTVMNCGGQSFCLDGNCVDTSYQPNTDFALAASYLSAVEETAADFDPANMVPFKGQDMRCGKAALGYSNCCKDKGWGLDLGLAQCDENEKILAQKKQAGQCHYVGTYCSEKALGACLKKKETYCCFNGKLARILQEQGRAQLGIGWGGPKSPNCQGLTPEQLTQIDWSRLDLSEFYADALAKINPPSGADLGATINERIQRLLP